MTVEHDCAVDGHVWTVHGCDCCTPPFILQKCDECGVVETAA